LNFDKFLSAPGKFSMTSKLDKPIKGVDEYTLVLNGPPNFLVETHPGALIENNLNIRNSVVFGKKKEVDGLQFGLFGLS